MAKAYVYIMANRYRGTIYVGVTNNLPRRVWEHQQGLVDGFTKKYGCKTLVYYESYEWIQGAIRREKQIKAWKREWKFNHIEERNPDWNDLLAEFM